MKQEEVQSFVPISVSPELLESPSGWRWEKLNALARLESGHTPSRARTDWWGGDISWVSLTEIRRLDGCWVEETEIKTNEEGIANSAARILPRGTVCFSRTASVGFVTIMGRPMATSQDFANWICGNDLDPEFLMYALIRSRNELRALATGATHKTIYMPTLEEFHLCLPKREVQELIVNGLKSKLAAVEEARQAAQAQLDDSNRLIPAILELVFSEITKDDFVKLGAIADIQLGKMLSPKSKTGKHSFTYLRNTNVQWGRFDLDDLAVMDFSDRERVKFELQAGDLIVCEGGEPGRCAVWNAERADCYYQKALHRVRPHKGTADSEFLSYWIRHQAYAGSFEDQNAKTTIAHLPLVRLEQLPIPNIPIESQLRIAEGLRSKLAAVDEILRAGQTQLEEVRRLPSRLLAQAFAGS